MMICCSGSITSFPAVVGDGGTDKGWKRLGNETAISNWNAPSGGQLSITETISDHQV